MKKRNLIRRQVIKLRQRNGWSQEEFAVKLQLAGWHNATRSTVSKIEGGTIGIAEYDLLFIAAALRVHFVQLFPEIDWQRPMDETVHKYIPQELHDFATESDQQKTDKETQWKPFPKQKPNQPRHQPNDWRIRFKKPPTCSA